MRGALGLPGIGEGKADATHMCRRRYNDALGLAFEGANDCYPPKDLEIQSQPQLKEKLPGWGDL